MEDTNFIAESIPRLESNIDTMQQHQSRQQHGEIVDWVSSTNYPSQQSDYISQRQEGTGQHFIEAVEFRDWVDGASQTLFCPGIPGAGKTMMAAIVIENLLQTVQSAAVGVSYVYCNYRSQESQSTTSIFSAILKQSIQAKPSIPEPAIRLYENHASKGTRPGLQEILCTLEAVLTTSYSRVYLVIDALDELPDNEGTFFQLLRALRLLQAKVDIRLLATSRPILTIANEFKQLPSLDVRASDADVRQFVKGQFFRLPNCIRRDDELQQTVLNRIVEVVDGM